MNESSPDDYILGTRDEEIDRLGTQHQTWVRQAYTLFERAELRAGEQVIDLGCGPGFTTMELANLVGPKGLVIAADLSSRFLGSLEDRARRGGLHWVRTLKAPVEDLGLPSDGLDAAYARWLFCWLPDPETALTEVARILRPGGRLLIQDYLDWHALAILPRGEAFDRAKAACLASFLAADADPRICTRMPELAERAGLELESLEPVARTGRIGSLVWRWVSDFLRGYLPGLVPKDFLDPNDLDRFLADLEDLERSNRGWVLCPLMGDVVLRKPIG